MGNSTKNKSPKKAFVNLKAIGDYKRNQKFEISQALKLLRLKNSAWKLDDEQYIFENNDIKRHTGKKSNNSAKKQ